MAIRRVLTLGALLLILGAVPASAQLEDALEDITGDVAEGYLSPLSTGLSATLNSGIFRSGHVPLAGLNFTLDLQAVVVGFSDDDDKFTPPLPPGFSSTGVPTVTGSTEAGVATGPGGAEILYPGGFDLAHFGVAVPQLSIGSVLGTRAIIRYISLNLADDDEELGDFTLFGIGGQHSISRYLPGLPVDVAAGIMYQTFNIGDDLLKSSALALNVTGSRQFGKIITVEPYVGLGIDSFKMEASYDFDDNGTGTPINIDFDRQTDPHFTLGANVNLPVVKLHGSLDVAAATGYAVGLSFGI